MRRPLYTRLRWDQRANERRRRRAIARVARETIETIRALRDGRAPL